jgi:ribose transport system permease protein
VELQNLISRAVISRYLAELNPARGFVTVAVSLLALVVACVVFAPSAISAGALVSSLPFAAIIAIVGLGQMLVVQQGGFDLSLAGGVSLAVVITTHVPDGDNALLSGAIAFAFASAVVAGLLNGILIGVLKLNAVVATIGMNALLYGAVFVVSGGVPQVTTPLMEKIASGKVLGVPHAVLFAVAIMLLVSFVLKKTVVGRQFEAIGAGPAAAAAAGMPVRIYQAAAYVVAQIHYCIAGILISGITREPTAFQGDSLLLPSVAVVVLAGTSLLGGRGFPISTALAALFLNLLSQFALAVGVPFSAQTIIQALALVFGISVYSLNWKQSANKRIIQSITKEKDHD